MIANPKKGNSACVMESLAAQLSKHDFNTDFITKNNKNMSLVFKYK